MLPKGFTAELRPLQETLKTHPLYQNIGSLKALHVFMEQHVFAVWDFMSLLKALQMQLTTIKQPWTPAKNPKTARFINEIVLGEETDLDENGKPASHFEMYLAAMQQLGANTSEIKTLLKQIKQGKSVKTALESLTLFPNTKAFVNFTFNVIKTGKTHCIAAAFTYGREDIIPDMFLNLLNKLETENNSINGTKLKYYLKRHIELDGDEHAPLALEMIAELCGTDKQKWNDVLETSITAIQHRIALWDGIDQHLKANPSNYIEQPISF